MQSFFAKNELMKNLMKILKLRAILEQFKAKFRQRKMKNSCGKFNIHFVTRARIVFSARKFFSRKNHFFHYPRKPFHQFKKYFSSNHMIQMQLSNVKSRNIMRHLNDVMTMLYVLKYSGFFRGL